MDRTKRERIGWALAGAKPPVIKYLSARARCHETLNLIEVRVLVCALGWGKGKGERCLQAWRRCV